MQSERVSDQTSTGWSVEWKNKEQSVPYTGSAKTGLKKYHSRAQESSWRREDRGGAKLAARLPAWMV